MLNKMNEITRSHHFAGFGLHPKYLPEILGKKVNRDLEVGDRMSWEYVKCKNE